MVLRRLVSLLLLVLVPVIASACGDDDKKEEGDCKVGDNTTCDDGMVCQAVKDATPKCFCSIDSTKGCDAAKNLYCEQTADGNNACHAPLWVKGTVFDLETKGPIQGARVVARDANNAAESGVAITNAAGEYELRVAAKRNADGTVATDVAAITLRADASGYLTFPTPPRAALPVELKTATGDPLTIKTTTTDIGMIPLANTTGLGTITGKVDASTPRGTLVVAGGSVNQGGGVTGFADYDGSYAVFNVPAGTVAVRGYKAGLQLAPESAVVTAGQTTENVDLHAVDKALTTIEGKVEIVNRGSGQLTSVILVVDETFNPTAIHGEAPPGLRAPDVEGAFKILDVPDGNYVVLAAFENDFLVRDPDTSIGGTSIVHITVPADSVLSQSFKVTGSLDDVSPDAEEPVSGTPIFKWADDSSEDHYEVVLFDALGTKIWENLAVPGVSGSKIVEAPYGGTALEPGMIYQFRATSIGKGGTPISRTEDLRGTFLYQ
jgi:hypothetical protein